MRILAGVPREWASNDSGVVENVDFQSSRTPHLRNKANIVIQYYLAPRRLSTNSKLRDLE